jgi:hypothetical protein
MMQVHALQDENATVVKVIDHRGNFTTGSSKRHRDDKKDYTLGLDLAIGRALVKHGTALMREAKAKYGRV